MQERIEFPMTDEEYAVACYKHDLSMQKEDERAKLREERVSWKLDKRLELELLGQPFNESW